MTIVSKLPLRHTHRAREAAGDIVFTPLDGRLFGESPLATDARQGLIGDCYFLSALSALARSAPHELRRMFRENDDGTVTVRFHNRLADGKYVAEHVTVDRTIPLTKGAPIYARSRHENEIWPILAEKAYAAWKGGYHVMGEGGLVEHTLEELTGQPTRMLFVAESKPEALWNLLSRATKEGWPAAVCTYGRVERPAIDGLGFHPNHILVFLGVHEWMGRRIVWLRDPFDVPACGALVKPDPLGVYTIGWEDFLSYFAEVELNGSEPCAVKMPPFPSHTLSESIDRSYVFHCLKAGERKRLAAEFTSVKVKAGELIGEIGTPVTHLYAVQHGSVAIETRVGKKMKQVHSLHAGAHFGEMHILDGRKYMASFRALTDMRLYRLPADRLLSWVKKYPELRERFQRRWDLQLTMLEWGSHQVTTLDADSLLQSGKALDAKRGETLYRSGEVAHGVYVVVEGKVHVHDGKRMTKHEAGHVFGESEVLNRTARQATAKTASKASLIQLDLGAAAEVMDRFDVVQRQLTAIAARRLQMKVGKRKHG